MEPFLTLLREHAYDPRARPTAALDEALGRLDRILARLAQALKVEYIGPYVGIGAGREAFCLAVRAHRETADAEVWAARVCSAGPHQALQARWSFSSVARLRKPILVGALPQFLAGYSAAVMAASQADTRAGRRLRELAHALSPDP